MPGSSSCSPACNRYHAKVMVQMRDGLTDGHDTSDRGGTQMQTVTTYITAALGHCKPHDVSPAQSIN